MCYLKLQTLDIRECDIQSSEQSAEFNLIKNSLLMWTASLLLFTKICLILGTHQFTEIMIFWDMVPCSLAAKYWSNCMALGGGVWGQWHVPAALSPWQIWYQLNRRVGGTQGQYGQVSKTSPPLGSDPRSVWPMVSPCTDYTIPGHNYVLLSLNIQRT